MVHIKWQNKAGNGAEAGDKIRGKKWSRLNLVYFSNECGGLFSTVFQAKKHTNILVAVKLTLKGT